MFVIGISEKILWGLIYKLLPPHIHLIVPVNWLVNSQSERTIALALRMWRTLLYIFIFFVLIQGFVFQVDISITELLVIFGNGLSVSLVEADSTLHTG